MPDVADLQGTSRRLRSWVEAREVVIALRVAEVSLLPEKSLADASRSTLRQANNWHLQLTPHRTLTITLPDATTMTTGPPKRNAA